MTEPKRVGEDRHAAAAAAARAMYDEHADFLRGLARHKFNVPEQDADELLHDVFASYLVNPEKVLSLREYLIGAMCNASRQYWRRQAADRVRQSAPPVPPQREELSEHLSRKLLLARALSRIGRQCRDLLHRYYILGESTAAIARSRGTSSDYVLLLLHKCRKTARGVIESMTRDE